MKNIKRITLRGALVALMLMGTAYQVQAQVSTSASASATIVTPISLSLEDNMSFGNVAVSSSSAGTVVLDVNNNRNRTGGVALPASSGAVSAARFTVAGSPNYTYAITLPSSCTLSDGNGHTMTINNFNSVPANTGVLSSGGTSTLKVGGTLNVTAGQPVGTYGNTTGVEVTVNYN